MANIATYLSHIYVYDRHRTLTYIWSFKFGCTINTIKGLHTKGISDQNYHT
jgi:hypothetical protein